MQTLTGVTTELAEISEYYKNYSERPLTWVREDLQEPKTTKKGLLTVFGKGQRIRGEVDVAWLAGNLFIICEKLKRRRSWFFHIAAWPENHQHWDHPLKTWRGHKPCKAQHPGLHPSYYDEYKDEDEADFKKRKRATKQWEKRNEAYQAEIVRIAPMVGEIAGFAEHAVNGWVVEHGMTLALSAQIDELTGDPVAKIICGKFIELAGQYYQSAQSNAHEAFIQHRRWYPHETMTVAREATWKELTGVTDGMERLAWMMHQPLQDLEGPRILRSPTSDKVWKRPGVGNAADGRDKQSEEFKGNIEDQIQKAFDD